MNGWLKRLTDLNGRWYTQNHYDRRGRVVRQELETGEEFVIFYDDAARQNTFLTGSTERRIQLWQGEAADAGALP